MGKFGHKPKAFKEPPTGPKASVNTAGPTDPSAMSVLGMTPPERPAALPNTALPQRNPSNGPPPHGAGNGGGNQGGQVSFRDEEAWGRESELTCDVGPEQSTPDRPKES